MTTELTATRNTAIAPKATPQAISELEEVAAHCRCIQHDVASEFRKTFALAAAKKRLGELITDDMMEDIMALQGSSIGFTTDLDSERKSYPLSVVKDVAIEATLRGLRMYGNEIVIISGRLYGSQAGMQRLVMEFPGISDLKIDVREPIMHAAYALVPCVASYIQDGIEHTVDCLGGRAIPVRVNKGMIIDAIIGKAKRKLFARIYDSLTGLAHGLVDSDYDLTSGGTNAPGDDQAHQEATLPDHYLQAIASTTDVCEISPIAKQIGADTTLSKEARAQGHQLCAEQSMALRRTNGGSESKPKTQGKLFETQASATEAGA